MTIERRRAQDKDMDELKAEVRRIAAIVDETAKRQVEWQSQYGDLMKEALCRKRWWKDVLSEAQKGGVIWTLRFLVVACAIGIYQLAKSHWHKIGL